MLAPVDVVTTTLPVVAAAGTVAVMLPSPQAVTAAVVPLKVTLLVPCDAPKLEPAMTTDDPTTPVLGVRLLMPGVTVNTTPLLVFEPTLTTTLPVVAPAGTGTVIELALQDVGAATVPLNVTELVPCVDPKLVPVIVTATPTAPEEGERLVMLGGAAIAMVADNSATIKPIRVYRI